MESYEEEEPAPSDPVAKAFGLLAWGVLAAIAWLPWISIGAGVNFLGYVLMFTALTRLAPLNPRLEVARLVLCGAAFLALIDAISSPGLVLSRQGFHAMLPRTLFLRDYVLAGSIWTMAGGLIELAGAKGNIRMRDAASVRRDLYLLCIVLEGLIIGPLMFLVFSRALPGGAMSAIVVAAAVFRYYVAYLWMDLCNRAAKGFEPEQEEI